MIEDRVCHCLRMLHEIRRRRDAEACKPRHKFEGGPEYLSSLRKHAAIEHLQAIQLRELVKHPRNGLDALSHVSTKGRRIASSIACWGQPKLLGHAAVLRALRRTWSHLSSTLRRTSLCSHTVGVCAVRGRRVETCPTMLRHALRVCAS